MSGEGLTCNARAMPPRRSPTVTIDDESDDGSWATAIAHTPHLAAQTRDDQEQDPNVND